MPPLSAMPPKKQAQVGGAEKEKIIEDKTLGLKNKKGAKQQSLSRLSLIKLNLVNKIHVR